MYTNTNKYILDCCANICGTVYEELIVHGSILNCTHSTTPTKKIHAHSAKISTRKEKQQTRTTAITAQQQQQQIH